MQPADDAAAALADVHLGPLRPDRFRAVLGEEQMAAFERTIERGKAVLAGRVVWNVNSTALGGGWRRCCGR